MSGELKKTSLLVEPPNRILPDEWVSIDKYFTSNEFAFNPTGYFFDVHYPSDFYIKRVAIQRKLKIIFKKFFFELSLTCVLVLK